MNRKPLAFVIAMALALTLTGCRAARPEEAARPEDAAPPAAEPQAAAEVQPPQADDGQNPVMNFVGVYSTDQSSEALVEAEGRENARITVTYAPSPWFHDQTVMSGRFDTETCTMAYTDATLTEYTYNSDGSVNGETVIYTDGEGRAVFDPEANTLTITEESPDSGNVTVYAWGPSPDMKTATDPDHYASVTAMDKARVETVVGFNARTAYLSKDWHTLADMIRYPITINGTALTDADAFLGYMMDKTVSDSDRQAMNDEDLLDMFVNAQGIMLGDGEIWLSDPNYGTDQEPVLQIIAINGIVGAADGETPARQNGERFETVITMEGMEETVRYEHIRSDTLGFEMDYDYESFDRQRDSISDRFVSVWDDPEDPENYLEIQYSAEDADTIAAIVSESLSDDYEIIREPYTLERAGSCIRIDASELKGGGVMPDLLQTVYIIPANDGCRIASAHYTIESAEGFGRRFSYMINTLEVIGRNAESADTADYGELSAEDYGDWTGADFGELPPEDFGG